jgi:hypothetical protein
MNEVEQSLSLARNADGTPLQWRKTKQAYEVRNPATGRWVPVQFRRDNMFVNVDIKTGQFTVANPLPMEPMGVGDVGDYMREVAARGVCHTDPQVARAVV